MAPRPGAIKEVDPTTCPRGWRGARALPSPPTHQALARLAARGPGAAQGAGPPLQQTSPSFPSAHSPPRVGISLPTALPSPRLSSPGGLLGSTNPVLTFVSPLPSPHSLLLTSPGFLDLFKKKTQHLPQAKHRAGHSSGPVAASPTQVCGCPLAFVRALPLWCTLLSSLWEPALRRAARGPQWPVRSPGRQTKSRDLTIRPVQTQS